MPSIVQSIQLAIGRFVFNRFFHVKAQERLCRQRFFYSAFKALSFNGIDGDYAEFGSHGCNTFDLAHYEARRHRHPAKLWAFDSFRGLPPADLAEDQHPVWIEGTMKMSLDAFHKTCAARGIPRTAYNVVPGFYDETLPPLAAQGAPANLALVYVDCDLYSSTKTVLEFLRPRLKHGMIVAFDDYFCWSPTQISGERRAMLEAFENDPRWELLPYMQYGWHGQSFVVEDKNIRKAS